MAYISTNQILTNTCAQFLLRTPLGEMIAIADENTLYFLEFSEQKNIERQIQTLQNKFKIEMKEELNQIIQLLQTELDEYFAGQLQNFKTPISYSGSDFQNKVWNELKKIPNGETRSYVDIAKNIGQPTAYRAVARANSRNQIAIIIPCHRVINANGNLGGYAGGLHRKQALLAIENPSF